MSMASSLFDPPSQSVVTAASHWLVDLLTGSLATTLCIVAVAILGLLMMSGRMQLRAGIQVTLGCFVLLGASLMAGQLQALSRQGGADVASPPVVPGVPAEPPAPLPPANYDPYAGASVPVDR